MLLVEKKSPPRPLPVPQASSFRPDIEGVRALVIDRHHLSPQFALALSDVFDQYVLAGVNVGQAPGAD